MANLAGKIAWVTGAGTGIGEAAALAVAEDGATVILTGRSATLNRLAVVLAAPDIDVDVFRAQMNVIGPLTPPMKRPAIDAVWMINPSCCARMNGNATVTQ